MLGFAGGSGSALYSNETGGWPARAMVRPWPVGCAPRPPVNRKEGEGMAGLGRLCTVHIEPSPTGKFVHFHFSFFC